MPEIGHRDQVEQAFLDIKLHATAVFAQNCYAEPRDRVLDKTASATLEGLHDSVLRCKNVDGCNGLSDVSRIAQCRMEVNDEVEAGYVGGGYKKNLAPRHQFSDGLALESDLI